MAIMEAIATQYLEADAASVTFSSIPATYEHLQVRGSDAAAGYSTGQAFYIEFNGSAGTAYSSFIWRGHTTTYNPDPLAFQPYIKIYDGTQGVNTDVGEYATIIMDVLDYTNTNKNTSVLLFGGQSISNTNRRIWWGSGMWDNTAAITQIKFTPDNGNVRRGSEFTLYGIKSS